MTFAGANDDTKSYLIECNDYADDAGHLILPRIARGEPCGLRSGWDGVDKIKNPLATRCASSDLCCGLAARWDDSGALEARETCAEADDREVPFPEWEEDDGGDGEEPAVG